MDCGGITVHDLGPGFYRNGLHMALTVLAVLCPSNSACWIMYGSFITVVIELTRILEHLYGGPALSSFWDIAWTIVPIVIALDAIDLDTLNVVYKLEKRLKDSRASLEGSGSFVSLIIASTLFDYIFAMFDTNTPICSRHNLYAILLGAFGIPAIAAALAETFAKRWYPLMVTGPFERRLSTRAIIAIHFWCIGAFFLCLWGVIATWSVR